MSEAKSSPLALFVPSYTMGDAIIAYKKGDASKQQFGRLNVVRVSTNSTVSITFCKVKYRNDPDFTISLGSVKDRIAEIYGVAGQGFIFTDATIEVNSPDKNGNNMLDRTERELFHQILKTQITWTSDYTVFIVNQDLQSTQDPLKTALGYSVLNEKYPKICEEAIVIITAKQTLVETYAHEIGHTVFGLKHPFDEFKGNHNVGKDPYNIMDYNCIYNKTQLRKYQIKQIIK